MATKKVLYVPVTYENMPHEQLEKPTNTTLLVAHLEYSAHLQQRPSPDSITFPINKSQTLLMATKMYSNEPDTLGNMPHEQLDKPMNITLLDAHLVYSAHLQQRPSPDLMTWPINKS